MRQSMIAWAYSWARSAGDSTPGTRASALWGKGGRGFALVAALACTLTAPSVARADAFVPQPLLERAAAEPGQKLHVIVVGSLGVRAGTIRNEKMKDANGNAYGFVRREYKLLEGLAADITGAQLLMLAKTNGIRSITPDAPVKLAHEVDLAGLAPLELWPRVVGANNLWGSFDSLGLFTAGPHPPAIAIIDSGVDPNRLSDFGGRVIGSVNLQSSYLQSTSNSASDDYGHGTLVAGIAAGSATAYPGVAPNADIVSLRVVDGNGQALTSDVIAAADWIYQNRVSTGIRVANFSIQSANANYAMHDPLNIAVRRLWLTGTVVVASAGNAGPQRMLYAPASDPFIITVGALDVNQTLGASDDFCAPWSSYGYTAEGFAKPELSAPGRYMVGPVPTGSTLATTFPERIVVPGYMRFSGTSFAAPVIAGAAAQLLARHPDWTPDQVKGALMLTARAIPNTPELELCDGVGEIDAAAAAALKEAPNGNPALARFVAIDPTLGIPVFDRLGWETTAASDASWANASWANASWANASWANASWANASWANAAYVDASWANASWANASWANASWANASWANANFAD